jgi:hypothetical protein
MTNEDIIKRLESVTLPDVTLESHRRELEASLLKEYASVQALYDRKGFVGWLRAGQSLWKSVHVSRKVWVVAVPAVAILVTVLTLHLSGSFLGVSGVIAKAYAATERIESYRIVSDAYTRSAYTDYENILVGHSEAEYASPSRYHQVYQGTSISSEMIIIDNKVYIKGETMRPQTPEQVTESLPSKEQTLEGLESLANIEELKDEYIDDTLCYHYRGTIDMDKYLEKYLSRLIEQMESSWGWVDELEEFDLEEEIEESIANVEERWRRDEIICDYWISKDDYLVRQADWVRRPLSDPLEVNKELIITSKYSDFNEDIIINPPLTETGELEEGWYEMSMENFSWLKED